MNENYWSYIKKNAELNMKIKKNRIEFFWEVIENNFEKSKYYVIDKEKYKIIMPLLSGMWGKKYLKTILDEIDIRNSVEDNITTIYDDRDIDITDWSRITGLSE